MFKSNLIFLLLAHGCKKDSEEKLIPFYDEKTKREELLKASDPRVVEEWKKIEHYRGKC